MDIHRKYTGKPHYKLIGDKKVFLGRSNKPRICPCCGDLLSKTRSDITAVYCMPCTYSRQANSNKRSINGKHWQKTAHKIVSIAVKSGILQPAQKYKCVDCGKDAFVYEHRDYQKPLDVEPVCVSCNSKRGSAINAKPNRPAA